MAGTCNRACFNPAHLEPVTRQENVRRGLLPKMMREKMRSQTHCKRGHELSGDNLRPSGVRVGIRKCRHCINQRRREQYAAKEQES